LLRKFRPNGTKFSHQAGLQRVALDNNIRRRGAPAASTHDCNEEYYEAFLLF